MSDSRVANMSRRTVLFAAAAAAPLLAMGRAEAAPTFSQDAVNYQKKSPNGNHCAICKQFVAPSSCKSVKGTIYPDGVCKLFVAKDG